MFIKFYINVSYKLNVKLTRLCSGKGKSGQHVYVDTLTRGLGRESGDPWIVHVLSELL